MKIFKALIISLIVLTTTNAQDCTSYKYSLAIDSSEHGYTIGLTVLAEMERLANEYAKSINATRPDGEPIHVAELFSTVASTSTSSIVAAGLTIPAASEATKYRYTVPEINSLLTENTNNIFYNRFDGIHCTWFFWLIFVPIISIPTLVYLLNTKCGKGDQDLQTAFRKTRDLINATKREIEGRSSDEKNSAKLCGECEVLTTSKTSKERICLRTEVLDHVSEISTENKLEKVAELKKNLLKI